MAAAHAPINKLIVGVDYGTTSTGVGYIVVHEDNQQGTQSDPTLLNWPLGGTKHKTPSRIAYDDDNSRGRLYWGFNVKPGMTACSWTKLLLNRSADRTEFDDEVLERCVRFGDIETASEKECSPCGGRLYARSLPIRPSRAKDRISKGTQQYSN